MVDIAHKLSTLEYLQRQVDGRLARADGTHLRYPTKISTLLGNELMSIGAREAAVQISTDAVIHGRLPLLNCPEIPGSCLALIL